MTQNEIIGMTMRGMISKATPEEQAAFAAAEADVQALIKKHGDVGKLAVVIVGIERAGDD
ncbi:hypothetical protein [Cupriavidus sp. RAF12]|uniref:hypothetical protein n=1 Tax=Cupriavidus sp. RAF12 TaxID=3233050 RepID=UPI003F8EE51D